MSLSVRRQTYFIIGLALSLAVATIVIATDTDLRERLGTAYWLLGLALIGSVLLVLAGYVFDRTLVAKVKELNQNTDSLRPASGQETGAQLDDPDEIMGLARKIEQMARALQQTEASYRAIVEDQADLICRYKSDGRLTFVNGAYARFFGRRRQDLAGQPWYVLSADLAPWRVLESWPENATFETTLQSSDNTRPVIQWTHRAIKDRDGQIIEYQAVGHDISVRKQAESALRQAKDAAESADRAKSEFLTIVSHEIRTPINGVIGFARLLRETPLTADQLSYIETIQRCGESLETLVSDILDLSRIEAGRLEIVAAPFSVRDSVDDILRFFQERARSAGLQLIADLAPDLPAILVGDHNRLRQILINLVGNAVKFTERGGITLRFEGSFENIPVAPDAPRPYRLVCSVTDTGVGIAEHNLPRLFRAFSQVDTSTTRRHGGTGLGLVISKRLCELMQGKIEVVSQLGKGSTFRFEILLACAVGDSRAPFEAR